MGSFTFKWADPTTDPSDVLVTGSFDGWTKSVTLEKDGGIFQKTVQISDEDGANKIYYKFVVDNNWVINESYPHETDHQGNVNNFLTADDLVKSTPAPSINTATPESTTVPEMGKKNGKKNKGAQSAATDAPATAGPAEVAEAKEVMATPSDVPGGFPVTPANEVADLDDKPVSINPLPASAGLGNPIQLAPGEKIPDFITSQDVNAQVKLDKDSYEKSDALPGGPPFSSQAPSVSGTMIPESSLKMGDLTDVGNVTINSVGPGSSTAALAGQVPLEPKRSGVPDVVKESQDKAGVPPEASAVPAEVKVKDKVEGELKKTVPEASATSVGIAGAQGEKKENSAASEVTTATAETINQALPDSVKNSLPDAAQKALAAEKKESPVEKISPQVPEPVTESIADAGESPEAAASTSAVMDKKAVEAELLKEVKEAPAVTDADKRPAEAPAAASAGTHAPAATATTASTAAATANGAETRAGASEKKKHRISVMFDKIRAKLK